MPYPSSGYGFAPPAPQKPRLSPLALAAAGANPYGFQVAKNNAAGPPSAAPIVKPKTAATTPVVPKPAVTSLPPVNPAAVQPSAPPTSAAFDINTLPSVQATNALTGQSDEQANASALQQKQQLALQYGSADFARALGLDDSYATAAAGNPTSTLASLGQQRDRNETSLTEGLNQDNLLYSGYRVTQEQQAAQDYQSALAQAAAAVNGSQSTISNNLDSALGANQQARIQGKTDATNTAIQDALASGETFSGYDANGNPIFTAAKDPTTSNLVTSLLGGGNTTAPQATITVNGQNTGIPDTAAFANALAAAASGPAANTSSAGQSNLLAALLGPPPGARAQAVAAGKKSLRY